MSLLRPTGPFFSAATTLATARAESSRVLRAALAKCEATRAQVAAQLACSDSRLSQFVDEQADPTLDIARAALLPLPARMAVAEWVMGDGYRVVAVPDASDATDLEATATIIRQSSELAATHLAACADHRVTRAEGHALERAAEPLVRLCLGVLELARSAQRGATARRCTG